MPTQTHAHFARRSAFLASASIAFAASSLIAAEGALAQPAGDAKAKPGAPVFVMSHTGLSSLLVDKKDANLKKAIQMMPARLRELPGEIPDLKQVPMPVVEMMLNLLVQPGRVAITHSADNQDQGMFGVGAVVSFGPNEEKNVNQLHGTVNALMAMGGMAGQAEPSKTFNQMLEFPSPVGGMIRYGPRQGKDGWRYEIHAGSAPDPDAVFSALPAPFIKDFNPVMNVRLDLAPIGAVAQQYLDAMGGPQGDQVAEMLKSRGLIGANAMKYTYQVGYTKDEQVGFTIVEGMKKHAKESGVPTTPLPESIFSMIPSDATVAGVVRFDLAPMLKTLTDTMEQAGAGQPIEQFKGATGVDPIKDLLGCLGGTFGYYMSESTGGQLASCVAFASLSDRPRFEQAHAKLVAFANTMLGQPDTARGYVRVRSWTDESTQLFTLSFPGLPAPVEVTWALAGDWVVVGMMPQSTLAATRQIAGKGDKGLRENKSFAAAIPANKEIHAFAFIDSPKVMKDGYQYVCLAGSAIANAARSPKSEDREPGLVIPTFNELRAGAKPIVSYSYWRGDDMIHEAHADRSMIVNITGTIGAAAPFFPLIGLGIGAAAAAGQSRDMGHVFDLIPFAH